MFLVPCMCDETNLINGDRKHACAQITLASSHNCQPILSVTTISPRLHVIARTPALVTNICHVSYHIVLKSIKLYYNDVMLSLMLSCLHYREGHCNIFGKVWLQRWWQINTQVNSRLCWKSEQYIVDNSGILISNNYKHSSLPDDPTDIFLWSLLANLIIVMIYL